MDLNPTILTCESDWKKITLEIPRDSHWDDFIDAFNTILSFKTFAHTRKDIVSEEIIYNYCQSEIKDTL